LDPDRVEPVKIIRGSNLRLEQQNSSFGTVLVSSSSFRVSGVKELSFFNLGAPVV
jgi:hypothetical protein